MKRLVLTIAIIFSLSHTIWAEGNPSNTGNVRYVKAPRFVRPLVERWIAEYAKKESGVVFKIAKGSTDQAQINLNIVLGNQTYHTNSISPVFYFGEFAILPITASGSEAAKVLDGKRLNAKKLKQLYFNESEDEENKRTKEYEKLVIYSGSNATSVATTFAHRFGEESTNFRGKRISGDDFFLNTALSKDPLGVAFNSLPNIYDLESRHIKNNLTLIGLDIKKGSEANLSDQTTLDELITILENNNISEIAIEKIGLIYNEPDDITNKFIKWILTDGTQYNHQYGLLNLDNKQIASQIDKVSSTLTAQK